MPFRAMRNGFLSADIPPLLPAREGGVMIIVRGEMVPGRIGCFVDRTI